MIPKPRSSQKLHLSIVELISVMRRFFFTRADIVDRIVQISCICMFAELSYFYRYLDFWNAFGHSSFALVCKGVYEFTLG